MLTSTNGGSRSRHLFITAVIALWGIISSPAALDLTATDEQYEGDGLIYRRLVCMDGERRVEMDLPNGWTYRNVARNRLHLSPPGDNSAEAIIATAQPLRDIAAPEVVRLLEQEVVSSLPPDSMAVTVRSADTGSSGPGARESIDVTVSFKRLGYTFVRSVSWVNYADEQLILQFTAREDQFESLRRGFRRVVMTLP
jgi:hypothetical protein